LTDDQKFDKKSALQRTNKKVGKKKRGPKKGERRRKGKEGGGGRGGRCHGPELEGGKKDKREKRELFKKNNLKRGIKIIDLGRG